MTDETKKDDQDFISTVAGRQSGALRIWCPAAALALSRDARSSAHHKHTGIQSGHART